MEVDPGLSFRNVSFRYSKRDVVCDVSFETTEGQSLAIVGESGAGKSTLLNLATGRLVPCQGDIFFRGINISRLRKSARIKFRRTYVGTIFQFPDLIPELSALENVTIVGMMRTRSEKKANAEAERLLMELGIEPQQQASLLSGGQQSRVTVARALIGTPALIIADEPTASLDEEHARITFELLEKYRDPTSILIVATHDEKIWKSCERTIHLDKKM
ncbi:MAG: ATP-binding cassette domain-containing protein [Actinomycetaceae bacterium]|nr:ATP-binding cassette domain-containing protein [Actinomycetaceae bacterium]